jgi:hypothetical protein
MTTIPKEWLSARVSVKDVEKANIENGRPFGYQHRKWERLKGRMEAGDELWEFQSPPASWAHLMGREGYALVRQGEIIEAILTTAE